MESAERIFLKYSFPCAQVLLDKGEITAEEYERLRAGALSSLEIPREELEGVFRAAFRRLRQVAGEDYWNPQAIRDYFINRHNRFIDEGEGEYARAPGHFKRMCKVYKARVVSRKGDALIVEIEGQQKPVVGVLVPQAKPGDSITVHLGFAIEVL